jgi:ribosomal protein S18 acetylase RimI-like enzyme
MKMQSKFPNLEIRIVNSKKEIPFHLLLAADPSEKLINRYVKNSHVFVGLLESIIIAVYVLSPLTKNRVEIKNISVSEEFQNKGIGTYLINHAIFISKSKGFKSICIGTSNASIGQLYLYQKQGFEIFKIEKKFFLKNYNQEIFENGIQCKHMLYLEKSLID